MERLTYRDKDGMAMMRERGGWKSGGIDRLAAYEDSGLEPEEIIGLKNTCEQLSGINDSLFKANQEMGKDMPEWKKAHDDGRLVVLPCKVGDTVYCPWAYDENKEIAFTEVESIKIYVNGRPLAFVEDWEIDMPMPTAFYPENFGKTVFLTREEAEKALKERER